MGHRELTRGRGDTRRRARRRRCDRMGHRELTRGRGDGRRRGGPGGAVATEWGTVSSRADVAILGGGPGGAVATEWGTVSSRADVAMVGAAAALAAPLRQNG